MDVAKFCINAFCYNFTPLEIGHRLFFSTKSDGCLRNCGVVRLDSEYPFSRIFNQKKNNMKFPFSNNFPKTLENMAILDKHYK